MIQRGSPVTLYHQLKLALCEQIRSRKLAVGAQLPSVRELIRSYKVSLPVVRQAMAELERDGIIRVEQGRGSFVARVPEAGPELAGDSVSRVLFVACSVDQVDPYFSRLLRGVQLEAAQSGTQVTFAHPTPEQPVSWLLHEAGHSAVILTGRITPEDVATVQQHGLSCVLAGDVSGWGIQSHGLTTVANDDFAGGFQAGQYLVRLGHRRFGVMMGEGQYAFWQRRLEGLEAALREAGLALPDCYISYRRQPLPSESARAAAQLLDLTEPPTAIFACNDRLAYGLYACMQERGLRIPDACSVVGFDDLMLSVELSPPLTTIHPDIEAVGQRAMRALRALQAERERAGERIVLPVTLVERGSAAPCPMLISQS